MKSLGKINQRKAEELIEEYNNLHVNDSLYTSTNLGRYLDSYFREHGLSYGDDFICPPFREGEIVKLTDKKVVSSRQIKSVRYNDSLLHKENSVNTRYIKSKLLDIISKYFPDVSTDNIFPRFIDFGNDKYINISCENRSDYAQGFGEYNITLSIEHKSYMSWVGYGKEQFNNDLSDIEQTIKSLTTVNSSRQIKSSKSQEEFENLVIDIENRLGVNVEHSNIFNLPVELTYEDECYIDDICREQNCRFIPVNGSRRQYRLIQSSRRNNMIKSALSKDEIIEKLNNIYYEIYDIAKEERDEGLYQALYDLGAIYNEEDLEEQGRKLEWIVRNAGWSDKADLIHNLCINSSRQIKSSTVPRTTKELADWVDKHTGWEVNYDEKKDVFICGPEDAKTHINKKGRAITVGPGWKEDHTVEEYMEIVDETPINSALDTVKVTFDNGDTIVTDYNADVGREEIAKYYMHNYFNVGNEDELHQVVKVEFPGNINSARVPEKADLDMAYQLEGYIESDHAMYDQFIVPVIKNLERKMKRGIFDYDKSLILWQHVADEGAKRYVKELGGPSYNVATRKEVAKNLAEYYKENYDVNGDIYNPIN